MTTDLICLLILALWTLPLNHIPAIARVIKAGAAWGMGNRETTPEMPDWVARADRAQRNHHDNLAMIATVILIAQVTQQTNSITAIASIAVVSLRILYSLTYIAGIPTVRSLTYAGSIASLLVIVWQILT
jgi:uncharacterized MAPEG superfamily protein